MPTEVPVEFMARIKRVASNVKDVKDGIEVITTIQLEGPGVDQGDVKELVNMQSGGEVKVQVSAIQPRFPGT